MYFNIIKGTKLFELHYKVSKISTLNSLENKFIQCTNAGCQMAKLFKKS